MYQKKRYDKILFSVVMFNIKAAVRAAFILNKYTCLLILV